MCRYCFLFFCCCIGNVLYGQNVRVELSIKWQNAKHLTPIAEDGTKIPFLYITYYNDTDTAFYFQKFGNHSYSGYPSIPLRETSCNYLNPPNKYELAIYGKDKSISESFIVNISHTMFAVFDTIQADTIEIILDTVNDNIFNIYTFLQRINHINRSSEFENLMWKEKDFSFRNKSFFKRYSSEININNLVFRLSFNNLLKYGAVMERYLHNLIFLKPHAQYTEIYNLVGFWYVGGNYKFQIDKESLANKDFGYTAELEKITFPKVLNGYQLYQGRFIVNKTFLNEKEQ